MIDHTLLKKGNIIAFPYLWKWQAGRGETEGRKDRPICVLTSIVTADGLTHLGLLAISSQPPRSDQKAIEIPQIECRRAGLSDWKRGWITVSEYNYDIAERSHYLEPNQEPFGRFSNQFMQRVAQEAAPLFRHGGARVDRTDTGAGQ